MAQERFAGQTAGSSAPAITSVYGNGVHPPTRASDRFVVSFVNKRRGLSCAVRPCTWQLQRVTLRSAKFFSSRGPYDTR